MTCSRAGAARRRKSARRDSQQFTLCGGRVRDSPAVIVPARLGRHPMLPTTGSPQARAAAECPMQLNRGLHGTFAVSADIEGAAKPSECPDSAYDAAAEGSLPAAVSEQAESGQFPLAVLRVVGEDAPRGVAGRSAWQVQDKVVVLGHCLLLCASRWAAQAVLDNRQRW